VIEVGLIKPIGIEEEMKGSYLDYAMSVIVARALPDARDGLKPVHRRILYGMHDLNNRHDMPYKKSARIVGEVMGKYHPHGDSAIYDSMVRMAQDFSMRYCLVDGQGNFGSMDDDPPAAMRYTEARLARISQEMLVDIDKDTVNFVSNFDDSLKEPAVLPARLPNLLANGSSGIAVGMATNIPPHNLTELCDAINYLIDHPDADAEELMQFVTGPDFPTAAIICGAQGIRDAYTTGRGKIIVRAKVGEETLKNGRVQIVVSELPYQTNKAALVEKIAELAKTKKVEGISEIRDESDRHGMRLVIELKKDAQPKKVINNLYKYTVMQSAFFINMLALIDGQPRTLTLKEALTSYINFRNDVITRRTKFDLQKAKDRAHILEGFKIALDNLDAVIATIRSSETAEIARTNLMKSFELTHIQAQAILEMQLRRLANLERQKILDEYTEILKTIAYLESLLADPKKILELIQKDIIDLRQKYGDKRRTAILEEELGEFSESDLIPHQEVVITLSEQGYIKRIPAETYRRQKRGGRGITGMTPHETDMMRHVLVADTHDHLLLFTNRGKVYKLRCYDLPSESRQAKGTAVINLIPVENKERVTALLLAKKPEPDRFMVMATSAGIIKKTSLDRFANVRSNGLIAMKLKDREEMIAADVLRDDDKIVLVTKRGQSIKFAVQMLRTASRTSGGVRGIRLEKGDRAIGMGVATSDIKLLTVTEKGYGKFTTVSNYPLQGRGGKGVKTHKVNDKTGDVIAALFVSASHNVIIASKKGVVIRISDEDIPLRGRSTQGVHLKRLSEDDRVISVALLSEDNHIEEEKNSPGMKLL